MDIRKKIVEIASSFVGLTADPSQPEKRRAYSELIAPGETPPMTASMLQMSGCALVVAGVWRDAGLEHKELEPPYKIGHAIARLITIAKQYGAWKIDGKMPQPGDMVLVGDNKSGGVEHVYTVTSVSGRTLTSVDGGQRDPKGYQCVKAKQRTWANGRDVVFEGSDPGSAVVGGRKIVGYIDVSKIPFPDPEDIYGK